jgi:hypothetical protein
LRDSFRLIERPQKRANVIAAGCGRRGREKLAFRADNWLASKVNADELRRFGAHLGKRFRRNFE